MKIAHIIVVRAAPCGAPAHRVPRIDLLRIGNLGLLSGLLLPALLAALIRR